VHCLNHIANEVLQFGCETHDLSRLRAKDQIWYRDDLSDSHLALVF